MTMVILSFCLSVFMAKNFNKLLRKIIIVGAENLGNSSVRLSFSDNTIQVVDIGSFIRRHPHPQHNKYLEPRHFSKFCIENSNIVWGKNWDLIFPIEQLHAGTLQ
jgi:hypothetical protein